MISDRLDEAGCPHAFLAEEVPELLERLVPLCLSIRVVSVGPIRSRRGIAHLLIWHTVSALSTKPWRIERSPWIFAASQASARNVPSRRRQGLSLWIAARVCYRWPLLGGPALGSASYDNRRVPFSFRTDGW